MEELLKAYEEEWGNRPTEQPYSTDYQILNAIDACSSMCDRPNNYLLSMARVLLRAAMEVEG